MTFAAVVDPCAASPLLSRLRSLDRQTLEAHQLRKLQALCVRLYAGSDYYRARMEAGGLKAGDVDSLERFREAMPTSDKTSFLEDQQAHPPFGTRLSIDRERVVHVSTTSGTSGQGQEIYGRTQRDIHILGYLHALPWYMAGLRRGDTALNCVPAGGMTTGGWGPGEALRIMGATAFHLGGLSTAAKIDLMLKLDGVHFIYASTNYLHTLTDALLARGIVPREAFSDMHGLFIAAEGYPLEWAAKIEEYWGCPLQEGYGSTQLNGFGGSTGSDGVFRGDGRGLIRLFEWESIIEIADPETGKPTAPGEVGEIIVTNLSVDGSPVVRFRTGDAARFVPWQEVGDGCAWNAIECGTIGRFDDMMKVRGNNIWPTMVDAAVFSHSEVGEYAGRLFTREGKTEIEVRYAIAEHQSALAPDERERLTRSIRERIKERTNIWMQVVEVPRSEFKEFTYKARRWKDERQEGYRL